MPGTTTGKSGSAPPAVVRFVKERVSCTLALQGTHSLFCSGMCLISALKQPFTFCTRKLSPRFLSFILAFSRAQFRETCYSCVE